MSKDFVHKGTCMLHNSNKNTSYELIMQLCTLHAPISLECYKATNQGIKHYSCIKCYSTNGAQSESCRHSEQNKILRCQIQQELCKSQMSKEVT